MSYRASLTHFKSKFDMCGDEKAEITSASDGMSSCVWRLKLFKNDARDMWRRLEAEDRGEQLVCGAA